MNGKDGGISRPSVVLFGAGGTHLYVGSTGGGLFELDVTTGTPALPPSRKQVVLGDGSSTLGSPTLDVANGLVYVGSEEGSFYSVKVPLQ